MTNNLLTNEFLYETLEELIEIQDEVEVLKKKYPVGSARRKKAIEADYQIEQLFELFHAAKEGGFVITEKTTAAQLIEERFGKTVDQLKKEDARNVIVQGTSTVWEKANDLGGVALDKTGDILIKLGNWLGGVK